MTENSNNILIILQAACKTNVKIVFSDKTKFYFYSTKEILQPKILLHLCTFCNCLKPDFFVWHTKKRDCHYALGDYPVLA
jgi:hypothetical protein